MADEELTPGPILEIPDMTPNFEIPDDMTMILQRRGDDRMAYLDLGMTTHHLWELIFEKYHALNATMLMRRRDEIVDLFDTMINAAQAQEPVNKSLFNRFRELDLDSGENASKSPVTRNWEQTARNPDRY